MAESHRDHLTVRAISQKISKHASLKDFFQAQSGSVCQSTWGYACSGWICRIVLQRSSGCWCPEAIWVSESRRKVATLATFERVSRFWQHCIAALGLVLSTTTTQARSVWGSDGSMLLQCWWFNWFNDKQFHSWFSLILLDIERIEGRKGCMCSVLRCVIFVASWCLAGACRS